ncbi:hypothetical protein LEP48_07910 [Isoptericola sp. NEAU-Y5]|uniref:Uncharacterized protein n=1 Tax=Isoptericola luteus TaxID=2879484 RepID=A0ABS7ZHH7_9MICO|nr:hypothetical protein [Isoptericola sp. NEAU-Y5]MCA5893284.1 hypothetical protein [Isoptericola sp. NEAU-Y5]
MASRGDELVLVGSAYDDRTERWTLAAWSSHEGESWPRDSAYEDLFPEDGPDKGSWFGEGTIVGDRLVAPVSIESSTQFLLVNRKADARWVGELDDEALQTDGTSREARQLAPSVQVSVTGDGPALTVVRGNGTAHFYDAELKYLGVLGAVTPWFRPLQTDDFRDGAPLPGVRTVFTDLGEDGWRSVGQTTQYVLEDDALVTSDDGAAPASDRRVIAGADPGSGQEVALYTGWDPDADTIVTTPWSRPLDGVWTQGVGFDEEFAAASTLVRTDDRWIAAGSRAESMNVDDLRHAAAWTSTDGIRWQDAGTLRSGPRGSDVAGACVLPTGEAVVVGSVDTGLIDEPVTWTSDGDTWTRRILDVGGDGSGHAERCLATDDGVTVFVDAGGRTQVFATQDGETIAKTWVAPEGTSLDSVVSWGESVVSAGWLDGAQYTGPVLRISREPAAPGPAWDWVPVPTRSRSGVTVHLQDDTLVVTTSDDAGVQAWRVDDVDALLARARPADDA